MRKQESYLIFQPLDNTPNKTLIFDIYSVLDKNFRLGFIRWYNPWRRYVLIPSPNTVWDFNCLKDVNAKINRLMAEREKQIMSRTKGITF